MTGSAESLGKSRLGWDSAVLQFKQPVATVAIEMMVMFLAGNFIARRVARDFHSLKPSLLNQGLDISINRRNPKLALVAVGLLQGFVRREWPIRFKKGFADSCLLLSVTPVHSLLRITSRLLFAKPSST